jgi:hypothetical protein
MVKKQDVVLQNVEGGFYSKNVRRVQFSGMDRP